jgi:hypothetical protein
MQLFLQLFILVKHSICFGQSASSRKQQLFDICLLLYVQSWAPDDGRKDRPKHVECFTRINNWRNWCIWLVLLQEYITMHQPTKVKLYCYIHWRFSKNIFKHFKYLLQPCMFKDEGSQKITKHNFIDFTTKILLTENTPFWSNEYSHPSSDQICNVLSFISTPALNLKQADKIAALQDC